MYNSCCGQPRYGCYCRPRYGLSNVIFDFFLVMITGGLWFLWILIRFLRSNTNPRW